MSCPNSTWRALDGSHPTPSVSLAEKGSRERAFSLIARMIDAVGPQYQQAPVLRTELGERFLLRHDFVEMRNGAHVPHQFQAFVLNLFPVSREDNVVGEIAVAIQDRRSGDTPVVKSAQGRGDEIVECGHCSVPEIVIFANDLPP